MQLKGLCIALRPTKREIEEKQFGCKRSRGGQGRHHYRDYEWEDNHDWNRDW